MSRNGGMSEVSKYSPGDKVRVIDGTFAGLEGVVVTIREARGVWETAGGEEPPLIATPGLTFVVLTLFERRVPVSLLTSQLEAVE
jgi:transcription antitermination factor NusG